MKKALIITYYWPPSGGAGVQRWLKFTKYLPEFGWEPVIYTPENPESPAIDNSLVNEIPVGITVLKNKIWEPFHAYKRFTGKNTEEKLGTGFLSESVTSSGMSEKISVWIRGNLFIPDAKCFWIKPSVKYLSKYLKDNPVDAIISTGPPHSMHLIAKSLKKKFNIPWVADFRDPWTEIDFYDKLNLSRRAKQRHSILEKSVIQLADMVITVGQNMSDSFKNKYNVDSQVITNGFDEEDLADRQPVKEDKFTILHVGSINKDRNHQIFWDVLKELVSENESFKNNLHIHFVGKTDIDVIKSAEESDLTRYVALTPYLEHKSSLTLEQSASVLYLPINDTQNAKGILTGKLFEYLAAKRPVLAIAPLDGDLAVILKKTEAGLVSDFNDKESLKNNILLLFNQFLEGTLKITSTGINCYSRRNLTEKLVTELIKVVK